jgi:hypothetical protein
VQQQLFVTINSTSESPVTIKILDSRGALIKMQNNYIRIRSNQLNINMNNIAAGIYFISAEWAYGQKKEIVKVVKE